MPDSSGGDFARDPPLHADMVMDPGRITEADRISMRIGLMVTVTIQVGSESIDGFRPGRWRKEVVIGQDFVEKSLESFFRHFAGRVDLQGLEIPCHGGASLVAPRVLEFFGPLQSIHKRGDLGYDSFDFFPEFWVLGVFLL